MNIKEGLNDMNVHELLHVNNIKNEPIESDEIITPDYNPVVSVKKEPDSFDLKPTRNISDQPVQSQLCTNREISDLNSSTCAVCQKKFPSLNILKLHERSHKTVAKASQNLPETTILKASSLVQVKLEIPEENSVSDSTSNPEVNLVPNIEKSTVQNNLNTVDTSVRTVDSNFHKVTEGDEVDVKLQLSSQEKFFCKECNCELLSEEDLRSHAQVHTGLFHCRKCEAKFKGRNALQVHVDRIHENARNHLCSVCQKSFKTRQDLGKHMQTHNKDLSHECDICHSKFKAIANLRKHFHDVHKRRNVGLECKICQNLFPNTASLQRHHEKKHKEKIWRCKECKNTFTTKKSLQIHIRCVHHQEKLLTCDHCSYTSGHLGNLRRHVQAVHKRGMGYNLTSMNKCRK